MTTKPILLSSLAILALILLSPPARAGDGQKMLVIVADHVSMNNWAADGLPRLREAEKRGAKVVLVGDQQQLQAIEAGAAFRAIHERHGGVEIEVVTRPALSVARGILDTTRDEGADMVVLGVQAPTPGGVVVGLDGIRVAYETGRGRFRIRATTQIESASGRREIRKFFLEQGDKVAVGLRKVGGRIG